MALAVTGVADSASDDYSDEAFKRGLVTFAIARALNGVISVAQGTEVAVEPGGVGVNFTVGQILDPINDLVEQFSSVMLVATSSLGLQNILLNMTGWWGVTGALGAASLFLMAAIWWPGGVQAGIKTMALRDLQSLASRFSAILRMAKGSRHQSTPRTSNPTNPVTPAAALIECLLPLRLKPGAETCGHAFDTRVMGSPRRTRPGCRPWLDRDPGR